MERPDLLKAGDEVEMSESKLNTLAGTMYYYTIEPALAMSDNIPALRRLTSLHATVKEVKYENSVYTVVAYCPEDREDHGNDSGTGYHGQ